MEITFSIVGSAGRRDDASKLSRKHFDAACIVADGLIDQINDSNYPLTHLVSGGAAWMDHVAVKLFLDKKVKNLRLYLPCYFNTGAFFNDRTGVTKKFDIATTLHKYHRQFQIVTGINSLSQIQTAQNEGAELIPCKGGFYGRNAMVAKSDFILACTFGKGAMLKDGGTADTVKRYLDRVKKEGSFDKSFHYELTSGDIFVGCQVPKKEEKPFKELLQQLHIPSNQVIGFSTYPP